MMSVETDIYKICRKTKNYMGKRYKEDLRIMKINNWTKCIQVRVKWKEGPEVSNSEAVASDDDCGEEEKKRKKKKKKKAFFGCLVS